MTVIVQMGQEKAQNSQNIMAVLPILSLFAGLMTVIVQMGQEKAQNSQNIMAVLPILSLFAAVSVLQFRTVTDDTMFEPWLTSQGRTITMC